VRVVREAFGAAVDPRRASTEGREPVLFVALPGRPHTGLAGARIFVPGQTE